MMMDSSGLDDGNNTLFLLHRLQELKEWQKEQEIKLSEEKKGVHFEEEEAEDVLQLSLSSTDDDDDTTIEQELPYVREVIDEKPIGVHKPFEKLLEEELLKDHSHKKTNNNDSPTKNVPHSFLRKGSGLQRFTPKKPYQFKKEEANLTINDSVEITRPPHEIVRRLSCDVEEEFSEVCDSVELSFMQKIKTLQKKEQEELAAFEILEEAAVDTSFSSNSSVVRKLIQSAGSKVSVTSTPKRKSIGGSVSRNTYTLSSNTQESARSSLNDEESDDTITNKIDDGESNDISNNYPSFLDQSGHSFVCETPNIYSFIDNNEVSKKTKTRSPLSHVKMVSGNNSSENQKFNSKISDLEKEILKYKDENSKLQKMKSTLLSDKRKLASDIQKFEKTKEDERKKLEEERRRIKRDEKLLEKAKKDLNAVQNNVYSKEVQFIQNKMKLLKEDFNRKESRWNVSYKKLQDKIKVLEKENQILHEENHRLKLRKTSSKVFKDFKKVNCKTETTEESSELDEKTPSHSPSNRNPEKSAKDAINSSPDVSNQEDMNSNKKNIIPYFKLNTPHAKQEADSEAIPFTYSGVDSLESDITLVDNSDESKVSENVTLLDVKHNASKGTTEKTYSDGTVEVSYSNGNRKECQEGVTKVFYYNGDVKISETAEHIIKYYYSKTKTWHLTYLDKEVFKFDNGQQEIRYKDGTHEIIFTDGSVKKVLPNGSEIIVFPDKTRVNVTVDGNKIISFPNGQVETHMPEYKKRQYLDGTVKILHNDGKQETRYANGRVRIKNKDGELIYDSTEAGLL